VGCFAQESARMKTGRPRTGQEALPKPTAGEVFPDGSMIELVRDAGAHSRLLLLMWRNGKATVSDRIEYGGQIYVPIELDSTLAQAVRLPTLSVNYGTTSSLFTQIKDLLSQYADVNEKDIAILSYFVLRTWFSDCMSDAPCLFVIAPHAAAEAHILFLLLSCLCRHALLLGEFTRSIVASLLVPFLQPTVLIDQPDLSRSALRQLRATNIRGRHVSHKSLCRTIESRWLSDRLHGELPR
jgi:hypothetical protein